MSADTAAAVACDACGASDACDVSEASGAVGAEATQTSLSTWQRRLEEVGASTRAAWIAATGPPFGTCAACFSALQRPVVLVCGHIVCHAHVACHAGAKGAEGGSDADGGAEDKASACRWAPACAERAFPSKPRGLVVTAAVVQALLDRGIRAPEVAALEGAAADSSCAPGAAPGAVSAAGRRVAAARSPLEAIEAYTLYAEVAAQGGSPAEAALAQLKVVQLWEAFAVPRAVMASRFDHFRLGAWVASALVDLSHWGACSPEAKTTAEEALTKCVACPSTLNLALSNLPAPAEPSRAVVRAPAEDLHSLVECPVCYDAFFEPVTVPCGHTICRRCLGRQLDFERGCPLCREGLGGFIDDYAHTAGLGIAVEALQPGTIEQGQLTLEKERKDMEEWLPVFVCSLAFPTRPCPLHIFEPRYRLMMRRAISSGLRRFGMCVPVEGPPEIAQNGYSRIGTVLFIREIRMLADGRSLVDCVGEKRFKVKETGDRDGYNVARVDYVEESDEASAEIVARCRSSSKGLRDTLTTQLGPRARFVLKELFDEDFSEDDETFFWQSISSMPVSDSIKFDALRTEGRGTRFKLLAAVSEAVLSMLRTRAAAGEAFGAGSDDGDDELEEEAEEGDTDMLGADTDAPAGA